MGQKWGYMPKKGIFNRKRDYFRIWNWSHPVFTGLGLSCSVSPASATCSWCAKMDSIPNGHSSNCHDRDLSTQMWQISSDIMNWGDIKMSTWGYTHEEIWPTQVRRFIVSELVDKIKDRNYHPVHIQKDMETPPWTSISSENPWISPTFGGLKPSSLHGMTGIQHQNGGVGLNLGLVYWIHWFSPRMVSLGSCHHMWHFSRAPYQWEPYRMNFGVQLSGRNISIVKKGHITSDAGAFWFMFLVALVFMAKITALECRKMGSGTYWKGI